MLPDDALKGTVGTNLGVAPALAQDGLRVGIGRDRMAGVALGVLTTKPQAVGFPNSPDLIEKEAQDHKRWRLAVYI